MIFIILLNLKIYKYITFFIYLFYNYLFNLAKMIYKFIYIQIFIYKFINLIKK